MHQICEPQRILTTFESASDFLFVLANTSTKRVSPYIGVYLVKVIAIATAFKEFTCEILSFYIRIWCTQAVFEAEKNALDFRTYEFPKTLAQINFHT